MNKKLNVVILAAGKGTRMVSNKAKVLHCLAGKPLVQHVIDNANELSANQVNIVYGHGGEQLKTTITDNKLIWCEQKQQLGTGHAVAQTLEKIEDQVNVLILYGDVPLLERQTLEKLILAKNDSSIALLTAKLPDSSGYGRIVRNEQQQIKKIVEHKDATDKELLIKEVNSGVMVVDGDKLKQWLAKVDNKNAQQEYYLTDLIELAVADGEKVNSYVLDDYKQIEGVNNKLQLAQLEREYQQRQAEKLMLQGVTLLDPNRFDLRGQLSIGKDVSIDINVIIVGKCSLGNNVTIGANSVLKNVTIGDNVVVHANCMIDQSTIANDCSIGPFARIRPETQLEPQVKIGNFVEIKKSHIAQASKVSHLSYIGDTQMGKEVNIGAGTITCNYDGVNKHTTKIGDNAFIGSNSALVAPIEIGKGATIGAGSTLNKNTPDDQLTISRSAQKTITNWQRPIKKEKK